MIMQWLMGVFLVSVFNGFQAGAYLALYSLDISAA
jgi:hypothetical protein